MGKNLALIAIFFALLFVYGKFGPGLPLSVVSSNKTDFFNVTAEGKVLAKPDVAEVNLGFTTTGSSVSQVQNQANETINKVTAAVKKLGVGESDIKTTGYNLYPVYDDNKITGYSISINIQAKVRDFSKVSQVIDAGTANGANTVGNLQFTVDDVEKYKSQARQLAINNAKKKASEIAGAAGINLGRLINVQEGSAVYPRPLYMAKDAIGLGGGSPSVPTQIEPGSSEISVSVTLSYETR